MKIATREIRRSWQSNAAAMSFIALTSPVAFAQCEPLVSDTDTQIGNAQAIAIEDGRLYVGLGADGVAAYQLSGDFGELELLDTFATTSFAEGIHAEGTLVLVANGWNGIQLIDYSGISGVDAGSADVEGFARSVEASNGTAFLGSDAPDRLDIFDVSSAPFVNHIGNLDLPGTPWDLQLAGDILFAACDGAGVVVVDISVPSSPAIVGQAITPGEAEGLSLEGTLLAVAAEFSGLQLLDVSDPTNPLILGSHDTPNEAHGVVLRDSIAVIADDLSGIHIFDVSVPTAPLPLGSLDTDGAADDVGVFQCGILVADGSNGVIGVDASSCMTQCGVSCPADMTGDGQLDFFDMSAFLTYFQFNDPRADMNSDGDLDFFDLSIFLDSFASGCP